MRPYPSSSVCEHTAEQRTLAALAEMDADLSAPYSGWDWQRIPVDELLMIQGVRLQRQLLDELKKSRQRGEEGGNG